ncbi:glycosyltransferase involved in cell wall biosynthesis [Paraburkholderia sp. RAU2J]|uniref:glycosyltransferase n=1 Tax=Paraburkholderia sp. RAU2J TaxID=1938810 RepID=UPI000EB45C6B|nr:glycosyltransferase [Paraburkholderia sp. RAU2J]RKT26250.1 glycosyltransferase involved in cell wall biosynthesis [Paraburkholderia sp. RAU2J]
MRLLICAPDIFEGDAVGNHCLGLAAMAERAGWESRAYAKHFDAAISQVRPIETLFAEATSEDLLYVSYSIFAPNLDRLLALPCRKICYYHGITDPALLREFEPVTADLCEQAFLQLPKLAGFDLIVTNSKHVAQDLAPYVDIASIVVIPPVFETLPTLADSAIARPAPELFNMLVLGRVVPHKRVEDAIEVLAHVVEGGVDATMTIVGSMPNYDYSKFLLKRARALGVLTRIDFTGMVDDADLLSSYDRASLLLSMSRHEGFCIPALEAMHRGIPAVVRAGHAAAEVVDDAGLVSDTHETAEQIAARIIALRNDASRWNALTQHARERAGNLLQLTSWRHWLEVFDAARRGTRS